MLTPFLFGVMPRLSHHVQIYFVMQNILSITFLLLENINGNNSIKRHYRT